METIVVIALCGIIIIYMDRSWRATTKELMDRIQAKDLPEYKALEVKKNKVAKQPKPKEDELVEL